MNSMPRKHNIQGMPVMVSQCSSCPFREDGDIELRNAVLSRTLLQASQVCHHPRLHGKKETHLCRGSRDFQLVLLHRMGFLAEPTDEAFKSASKKAIKT